MAGAIRTVYRDRRRQGEGGERSARRPVGLTRAFAGHTRRCGYVTAPGWRYQREPYACGKYTLQRQTHALACGTGHVTHQTRSNMSASIPCHPTSHTPGGGLVYWHPAGAMVRHLVETFWKELHLARGYQLVYSPHIAKADLWKTSGHLDFYRENMYEQMKVGGGEGRGGGCGAGR